MSVSCEFNHLRWGPRGTEVPANYTGALIWRRTKTKASFFFFNINSKTLIISWWGRCVGGGGGFIPSFPEVFLTTILQNNWKHSNVTVDFGRRDSPGRPSFHMQHLFLLILLAELLSGNNMFLSARPCQTSDKKTVGHNYPVCSEAQCFLLFKSPRAVRVLRGNAFSPFFFPPCCVSRC